jgi:hypothetical protein
MQKTGFLPKIVAFSDKYLLRTGFFPRMLSPVEAFIGYNLQVSACEKNIPPR